VPDGAGRARQGPATTYPVAPHPEGCYPVGVPTPSGRGQVPSIPVPQRDRGPVPPSYTAAASGLGQGRPKGPGGQTGASGRVQLSPLGLGHAASYRRITPAGLRNPRPIRLIARTYWPSLVTLGNRSTVVPRRST
jgi:hypothetical protein